MPSFCKVLTIFALSGANYTPGKRVYAKSVSRVRISVSPLHKCLIFSITAHCAGIGKNIKKNQWSAHFCTFLHIF